MKPIKIMILVNIVLTIVMLGLFGFIGYKVATSNLVTSALNYKF